MPFYLFRGINTPMCFNKYMGYGHVFLTIILFQGFPFLSIGWYIAARYMTDVTETYLSPYFAFYIIQAFPLIYWYDKCIHDAMFAVARGHENNIQLDEAEQPGAEQFLKD